MTGDDRVLLVLQYSHKTIWLDSGEGPGEGKRQNKVIALKNTEHAGTVHYCSIPGNRNHGV